MKSIGAYKGFRGLYEIRDPKTIMITIYRSGYKYVPLLEIRTSVRETETIYEFRKAIDDHLKLVERYPDLIDRNRFGDKLS